MPQPKLFVVTVIPPDLRAALAARYELADLPAQAAPASTPGCEIAVTTSMRGFDGPLFDAFPDLKLVVCNGAGLDRIDLDEAHRRGVAVCHTPDELADDVAEAVIALTYAIMRRVAEADRFVRAGRWGKERMVPSSRVAGKSMGIVGLGKIGRRVAASATALGMEVAYSAPRQAKDVPYPYLADPAALAERADVLVLCCPAGESTHHLVNRALLERLGPNGYLVNVARGSVVDEAALLDALETRRIAGAALDVFASEPNLDPRFLALDNVVLQPHSTSITHETRAAMLARLLSDLDAYLTGRPFHDAAARVTAQADQRIRMGQNA